MKRTSGDFDVSVGPCQPAQARYYIEALSGGPVLEGAVEFALLARDRRPDVPCGAVLVGKPVRTSRISRSRKFSLPKHRR